MDFFELINKRRSVRKFKNTKVPESVMRKCLKASLLAANSSNLQPWEFYWIRDPKKKETVVKACFSQNAAKEAKELVIAVSKIDTWKRKLHESLVRGDTRPRDLVLYEMGDNKNSERHPI